CHGVPRHAAPDRLRGSVLGLPDTGPGDLRLLHRARRTRGSVSRRGPPGLRGDRALAGTVPEPARSAPRPPGARPVQLRPRLDLPPRPAADGALPGPHPGSPLAGVRDLEIQVRREVLRLKPFDQLTIRGKARRLRPLALSALEQYDLDVERLELVRNDLNGIFRVRTADGRSYLLRVCLPNHHTLETLQAEVAWLQALEAEPDIAAPAPIPAANGEHIVTASAPGVPEPRRCMVFSWLPGRPFQRP